LNSRQQYPTAKHNNAILLLISGYNPKMAQQDIKPEVANSKPVVPEAVAETAVPKAFGVNTEVVAETIVDLFSDKIDRIARETHFPADVLKRTIGEGISKMNSEELGRLLKNVESESTDYSVLKGDDLRTRIGVGQTTMISAGAVRDRIGSGPAEEYTRNNYKEIAEELNDPEKSITALVKVLKENRELYSNRDGRSREDNLRFAVAKHLAGDRDIIGRAQEAAAAEAEKLARKSNLPENEVKKAGQDAITSWESSEKFLPQEIRDQVSAIFNSQDQK